MLPAQGCKSHANAGNACYEWLEIVVGAHCGGSKHSLSIGHNDEVDKSTHHYNKCDFKKDLSCNGLDVKREHFVNSDRQDCNGGKSEHPLVEHEHMVTAYYRGENR